VILMVLSSISGKMKPRPRFGTFIESNYVTAPTTERAVPNHGAVA
jgi:hypothetical protein